MSHVINVDLYFNDSLSTSYIKICFRYRVTSPLLSLPSTRRLRKNSADRIGRFEIDVTRETFPLFAREKRYSDETANERAREPTRCPSSRRIERKETPKKNWFFLSPSWIRGRTWPVRGSLRARRETFDRILNFVGAARCSGGF